MINIGGDRYHIEKIYSRNVTIPDCFVASSNKIGHGHGEAKLYIGDKGEVTSFFDFSPSNKTTKAFMLKSDLLSYLTTMHAEYLKPSLGYVNPKPLPDLWLKRYQEVQALKDEVLLFDISFQSQIAGPRGYINSSNALYTLIRKLSLPLVTFLSIMRVKDATGCVLFYMKLIPDFEAMNQMTALRTVFNYGKKKDKPDTDETETKEAEIAITETRTGQARYRQKLLDECPFCPITKIVTADLLIASHIKPYWTCSEKEKYDPKNGFIFSPLYDKLFDKGLLTFTDERRAVFSPWLPKGDINRLQLKPNEFVPMLPLDDYRKPYMEFHRKNVFQSAGQNSLT